MSTSRKTVLIYCITYLLLCAILASISTASDSAFQVGDSVPLVEAVSIEGMQLSFHPPGKKYNILLVSFLNVNDENHEEYLKDLIVLYRRFHGYGLRMVSVYTGGNEEYITSLADKWKIPWNQVLDDAVKPKRPFQVFDIQKTPANILIGQAGKVLGLNLRGDDAHTTIGKLLNVAMSHTPMPDPPVPYAIEQQQQKQQPSTVGLGMGMGMGMASLEKTQQDVLREFKVVSSTPLKVAYFQIAETGIRPTIQVLQKNSGAQLSCGWRQGGKEHLVFENVNGQTSKRIFRPGSEKFDIYITVVFRGNHKWSSDSNRNPGKEQHVRIFELKPEKPYNLPAYLLTWEDTPIGTLDDDFQDIIIRLDGVKPYSPQKESSAALSEKEAITAIEQYGGFLKYDEEGRVEEVNLVYGEDANGKRIECQNTSDTILEYITAFPDLKRLLIHRQQATDRVMPFIGKLTKLEKLYMWSATVSDKGITHLTGLKNLMYIHCSSSKITDLSLQSFSQFPQLEEMSLQNNNLSDNGLKSIKDMVQLKKLYVGINTKNITDKGVQYLLNLKNLEVLDIQGTSITDKGLKQLKGLSNLEYLWMSNLDVSGEAIDDLKKAIPDLKVKM